MKLPDVNLLIYAADGSSRHHERARSWLEEILSGTEQVGFAWLAMLGFIRIATNPVAFANPLSTARAFEFVDSWLGSTPATVAHPTHRHAAVLHRLLEPLGSADTDFARFEGLRWQDPLA